MADVDTSQFQEELDTIVNEARAVLARMDEVKHRFDAVAAKVDAVHHELDTMKTTIDQRVGHASGLVEGFYSEAHTRMSDFPSHTKEAVRGAVFLAMQKLTEVQGTFEHSADSVYAAVDNSRGVLQQLGDLVKSTDHDTADGVRQGVHHLQENIGQFVQAFDGTTQPSLNVLDDLFHQVQQQAETHAHETHDLVQQLMHETDEHVQQGLLAPVMSHVGEAAERMGQIASGDVDASLQSLVQEGRESLENRIKAQVSELVDKVAHEIDTVAEHLQKAGDDSAIPREAMKPLIDGIEALVKPVEETIGNVKSIASAVGFDV